MTSEPQGQESREVRLPLAIVSIVSLRMHDAHNACPQSLRITVRVASLAASEQRWQRTSPDVAMLLFEDGNAFVVAAVVVVVAALARSVAAVVWELLIRA